MSDDNPHPRLIDRLDGITKPLRNLVWLSGILLALWVQFLGPGLSTALRKASGTDDLRIQMEKGFDESNDRLNFIEDNMTPPRILNWLRLQSLGPCTSESCRKMHTISRTPYGQNCGRPSTTTEIKLQDGERFPLHSDFIPVEADLVGTRVIHNFTIEDFVPAGLNQYRFTLIYPDCEWSREPLPRYSPWFNLYVVRPIIETEGD